MQTAGLRCWSCYLSTLLSSSGGARLSDIGNEVRLCPCCSRFGEVAQSCTPQHSHEPKGRKYEDFFELAGSEENQVILFGVRRRALFQQKDLEPEPQPKELSGVMVGCQTGYQRPEALSPLVWQ